MAKYFEPNGLIATQTHPAVVSSINIGKMKKVSIETKKVSLISRIDHDRKFRMEIEHPMLKAMDKAFKMHPLITLSVEKESFHRLVLGLEVLPQ